MAQDIWLGWARGISIDQQLYCEVVHKGHRAGPTGGAGMINTTDFQPGLGRQ
jgi:hypothetical protein